MGQTKIVTYKPHRCTWASLQPWALSNKLCILSEVRVGHPLVVCEETLKGQSVVNLGIHVGCQSTRSQKWLTGHIFFSTPIKRDTRLTTKCRGESAYRNDSEATSPCHQEKPMKIHTASNNKRSAKRRCCVVNQHLPRYELTMWKLSQSLL